MVFTKHFLCHIAVFMASTNTDTFFLHAVHSHKHQKTTPKSLLVAIHSLGYADMHHIFQMYLICWDEKRSITKASLKQNPPPPHGNNCSHLHFLNPTTASLFIFLFKTCFLNWDSKRVEQIQSRKVMVVFYFLIHSCCKACTQPKQLFEALWVGWGSTIRLE